MSKNPINILLGLGSIILYFLVIGPLYKGTGVFWHPEYGVATLNKYYDIYQDTFNKADALYKQAENLQAKYVNVPSDLKRDLNLMVPDKIDPIRLISEIDHIANNSGIVLKDISYINNISSEENYGSYTVSFSFSTTYAKFKELMRDYEMSKRLFFVRSVKFSANKDEGSLTNFDVKLDTYYMKSK